MCVNGPAIRDGILRAIVLISVEWLYLDMRIRLFADVVSKLAVCLTSAVMGHAGSEQ